MLEDIVVIAAGSAWTYAVIAGIVAFDGFFPVVPGETAVVTGGVLAAQGDLSLALVVFAAFAGAIVGDNVSYLLGARVGDPACSRLFRGARARRRLEWVADQLAEHGRVILVVARFVPGGRTATTLSWGALHCGWRRFLSADAVGAGLWALFAAALGRLGGGAFADSAWKALLAALIVATVIGAAAEVLRRGPAHRPPTRRVAGCRPPL